MDFAHPLVRGHLVRRYKRFLADVMLDDGRDVTAHCPNPGAMLGLAASGQAVWLEPTPGAGRKLGFGWRLVELEAGGFAGIDTGVPNRVIAEALRAGDVPELAAYPSVRPEVRYGAASRVDFVLTGLGLPDAYVEVKNVHLRRTGNLAEFPDSVTARGTRHLHELARVAAAGGRAVMLYLVQRTDCARLALAADIDPAYAAAFVEARRAGVEAIAYGTRISTAAVTLAGALPVAEPGR